MKHGKFVGAVAAGLILGGTISAQESARHPVTLMDEVRITIDHRADADGYIRVRLIPETGDVVEVTIDILRRMSENDIAQDIANALTVAAGDAFRVRRSGGEHVDIDRPRQSDLPDFAVEIAFNVPGLSINMHE